MTSTFKQKQTELLLWTARKYTGCLLGKVLANFKACFPQHPVTKVELVASIQQEVQKRLLRCYIGTFPNYKDLVLLEEPLDFQALEDPKYWQWPIQDGERCGIIEFTLKGAAFIGVAQNPEHPKWMQL